MGAVSRVLVGECSDISTCPTGMADGAGGSGGKSSVSTPNWEKIKFNWTREDTCLLIENFELYPELWNVHTAEFKDRIKKQNELQKLADLFNTSIAEIQFII
nr:unnamed protein product [Callosobruchus chinensis]